MAVYILHIDPPYQHASHYIGFTSRPISDRVADHFAGRGSPLIRAALEAGCSVSVAHAWHCGTRGFERWLKNRKDAPRYCRLCGKRERPRPTFAGFRRSPFYWG